MLNIRCLEPSVVHVKSTFYDALGWLGLCLEKASIESNPKPPSSDYMVGLIDAEDLNRPAPTSTGPQCCDPVLRSLVT